MCQVENTKMTRREALLRAIKYIGDNDPELTHKLNEMIEDMPMTHWSAAACYDAIEDFYITHGRFPRMEDFKRSSKLPTLPTIRNRFHMPALQWLRSLEHYTPAHTNSALVAFIDEYNRIHPVSGPDYNIKKCLDRLIKTHWITVGAASAHPRVSVGRNRRDMGHRRTAASA